MQSMPNFPLVVDPLFFPPNIIKVKKKEKDYHINDI